MPIYIHTCTKTFWLNNIHTKPIQPIHEYIRESDMLCSFLCVDVINVSECKPVLQPMFDFTPNENGCTVVRMKRGSKPRGKIYSTNKAAATAAVQAPSP